MGGQTCGIGSHEVIEEEEIDQLVRLCAGQGATVVRCRHITYMTRPPEKVALRYRDAGGIPARAPSVAGSAPDWLLRSDAEVAPTVTVSTDGDRLGAEGRR